MARVLVVDDVRFILQMIASIFRDQGHEVLTAENGPDAIEMAKSERPDLILLDIAMPGMDGVEVARELRADGSLSGTRILMVTAQSDTRSFARATEAGADDYVCKPFDTPTLLGKAGKLLGSYRMNLSLDEVGGVPVVTVLTSTLDESVGTDVDAALDEACSGAGPVILDVGRVTKVDPPAVDVVLRHARAHHDAGIAFHLIQPGRGIGTRTLSVRLEPYARLHEDRAGALKAAGAKLERRKPARPVEAARPEDADPPAAAKPDAAPAPAEKPQVPAPARNGAESSAPRTPAPSDVLVDVIGNVAMVRVRNHVLADALPAIRQEVLPRAQRNVLVTLKDVGEIGAGDVGELDALAHELQRTGRSLKLVDPKPEVAGILREGGLGRLVVDSAAKKSEATRASS